MLNLPISIQTPLYVSPVFARFATPLIRYGRRTNCGHSFCLECILGWLSVQLDDFQASNPGFILADNAMDILRNPLSNPDGFVEAVKMAKLRYPRFTCPACRSVMTRRPVPFVAVEHVFTNPCVRGGGGAEAAPPSQLDLSQANRCFEHYLLF